MTILHKIVSKYYSSVWAESCFGRGNPYFGRFGNPYFGRTQHLSVVVVQEDDLGMGKQAEPSLAICSPIRGDACPVLAAAGRFKASCS